MIVEILKPVATHRCKVCGALWRFWRKEEISGSICESWQLCSEKCGDCCDNSPMSTQIEPATLVHVSTKLIEERDLLRSALAGIVGASQPEELRKMELVMRSLPAPDQDKAVTLNAIHALIATAR